jgi:UDP-N-acetylglucosamine 1-carboxyvinyltransferase
LEKLKIIGGSRLEGSIECSGSKNAALPILAASILSDKTITFDNLPYLQDITTMFELLGSMGVDIILDESMKFSVDSSNIKNFEARYELVKTMRASILVLGALLGRYGQAKIALPGGCAIGTRPVNFHLNALEQMGAEIELDGGYIVAKAKNLSGADITFGGVTVTGTENLIMAAVLADGETILRNAAREPEVVDLANFLNSIGAKIEGAGTDEIHITGVAELKGGDCFIPSDRIEAGTYLAAATLTNGSITVNKVDPNRLENILSKLRLCGADIKTTNQSVSIEMNSDINPVDIQTQPFPGFPTDMQAQFTVINALSRGSSVITENVFENRFMHVQELVRMGCNISIQGKNAFIQGVKKITGAQVMATDLRASACLILAGLCAEGETIVDRIYHIDRGYERIEEKLSYLGANIVRLPR